MAEGCGDGGATSETPRAHEALTRLMKHGSEGWPGRLEAVSKALAVATIAVAALGLAGCSESGSGEAAPTPKNVAVKIDAGTPVPLMLLTEMAAGSTDVGSKALFMVADDVKDGAGNIVLKRGSLAEGEVVWSRSEGMLSGIVNQPARLAVKLGSVNAADGTEIPMRAEKEAKEDEPYQFNRENTAGQKLDAELDKLAEANQDTLKNLSEGLESYLATGDPSKLEASADVKSALDRLLHSGDLEGARKSLDPKDQGASDLRTLSGVIGKLKEGSVSAVAASEVLLAVSALEELGKLAGSAEKSLGRIFRGRTLKAHVGTRLKAYCAKDATITVPAGR